LQLRGDWVRVPEGLCQAIGTSSKKSEPMHQIIWDLHPPISVEVSVNTPMKSRLAPLPFPRLARLALLYMCDDDLERVVRRALWGTATILFIARTVDDALQIVCRRHRELDVAIMAFSEDCHAITLLSAIRGCCEQLPTLVVVDKDSEQAAESGVVRYWEIIANKLSKAGWSWGWS
jgi:hypothetical protein